MEAFFEAVLITMISRSIPNLFKLAPKDKGWENTGMEIKWSLNFLIQIILIKGVTS